MARATAADVAREAGVSQPTVSRVFSGASVSEDKVKRVRDAADKLGYRPNALARSLITGRSRTIGLVVAYFENPFYAEALEQFSAELKKRGYALMLFLATNDKGDADTLVEDLIDRQVDGVVLASISLSGELTDRLRQLEIPLVLFNRGTMDSSISAVTSANVDGAARVANYLLDTGHKRIAHIAGWGGSSTGRDRRHGFESAMAARSATPHAIIEANYFRDSAMYACRILCRGELVIDESGNSEKQWQTKPAVTENQTIPDEPPDAIFVGNDYMAFAVLDCLRSETRLRVPEDISVVGYDDVQMAAWPAINLTTFRQPAQRMVGRTLDVLFALIESADVEPQHHQIDGELIIRNSSCARD